MKNPFNTIFGRAALMTTGLLVLAYIASLFVLGREVNEMHAEHESRGVQMVEEARRDGIDAARHIASALGATYLDARDAKTDGGPPSRRDTHGLYENALRDNLPAGSQVVLAGDTGTLWVRYAGDENWIRIPDAALTQGRLHSALGLMLALAIIVAFLGAWHAQRPLRRLASAAREFRIGVSTPVVRVSGPREVAELITRFNEMIREISEYEQERAMMLAGVAHDLRTPLTRMQVRADLMPDGAERIGFLGDVESLGRIVKQFLDFVRDRADGSPLVSVDAFCQSQYGSVPHDEVSEDSLVKLDLLAGGQFRLPLVDLDRILANLLENAMTYGEPPVEIATGMQHGKWTMTLRDHGPGIPDDQIDHALQPFVRLDAARGGDAHCGLGLVIVRRLARRNGGTLSVANAVGGGLLVSLVFS
ncbi:ATP-binding protein [Paraburkholderia fungorum]|uniref:ATP-binding protein n=1 Tax=Paraburkholderia fungorum TaxID=134537 RepID=UPI000DB28A91|nr:ATP-binding protein [Paraburkholderia fungorum]PZR47912.1 MAG: two-component sensor histidine kinase [Paraburkholderia fungorum]